MPIQCQTTFPIRILTEPVRQGLNYIRNSVKAVVDMYDGTVSFYVMDPDDPVLAVYRRAFSGMFSRIWINSLPI